MQVHFLSHYYTEQPNQSPFFVAGLGIPDLTPGFARIHNSIILKKPAPEQDDLKEIHQGIVRHYAGDKWFHASALFAKHVSLFCSAFLKEGLDRERLRLSVIAHIAVEMMIDRQIMLTERIVCERFYEKIMMADEKMLLCYFDFLKLGKEKNVFISRFGFFKEKKFLFLFEEIEKMVFGVDRIYSTVTQTKFTNEEKDKFIAAFHNMDAQIRYSWKQLLKP
ncbi:MAG: hypothetical protein IPP77_10690 [Bacteroidetes bacterium]|nr:hypothetical protein [Bacteroidota bacterium]